VDIYFNVVQNGGHKMYISELDRALVRDSKDREKEMAKYFRMDQRERIKEEIRFWSIKDQPPKDK